MIYDHIHRTNVHSSKVFSHCYFSLCNSLNNTFSKVLIDCLFVCVWFFVPLEIFHSYEYGLFTIANFYLCSAISRAVRFFTVPHLLLQGASVYNGHHRVPVTFTPIAERLAVELSLGAVLHAAAGIRTTNLPRARRAHCATSAV